MNGKIIKIIIILIVLALVGELIYLSILNKNKKSADLKIQTQQNIIEQQQNNGSINQESGNTNTNNTNTSPGSTPTPNNGTKYTPPETRVITPPPAPTRR